MGRAKPLPPDERKLQILRVTEPLLLEHGARVTTRQIAEAAGIAEGTVFRSYPTKNELLREVVLAALDPDDACAELTRIEPTLPLADRIGAAIRILRDQVERISNLMVAVKGLPSTHEDADRRQTHHGFANYSARLVEALTTVLEPDADRLALPLNDAAAYLRGVVFITQHPMMRVPALSDPTCLAEVLLHGMAGPPQRTKGSP